MQLMKSSCQQWLSVFPLQVLSSIVVVMGLYCKFSTVHIIWAAAISFHETLDLLLSVYPGGRITVFIFVCSINWGTAVWGTLSTAFPVFQIQQVLYQSRNTSHFSPVYVRIPRTSLKKNSHVTVLLILKLLFSAAVGISRLLADWCNAVLNRSSTKHLVMSHHTASLYNFRILAVILIS